MGRLHPHPRVIIIASHARRGGQEGSLAVLAREAEPDRIAGIVALERGLALPAIAASGAPTWALPTPGRAGIPLTVVRLRRLLLRQRPELVHADGTKAAICALLATAGTRIPVLWMRHDGAFDGWVARAVARRCAAVVGVSRAVLDTFDGLRGIPIRVVRPGVPEYNVDRAVAARTLRSELGVSADAAVVVQVGRIVPNKGQLDTVEACPAVLARHPSTRFAFIGEPDVSTPHHRHEVEQRARQLGVEAAISFLGYREDAVELIAGADIVVMPSLQLPGYYGWREGFGIVVAEAMAVGTPVVVYDDPALVETLAGSGVVVPSGDRRALGTALGDLLDDPERRRQLAEAGRHRARELGTDRVLDELAAVYASVASR